MRAAKVMAVSLASAGALLLARGTAHAEHTTRSLILEDNGLDYALVALALAIAFVGLAAFAVVVLRWERQSESDDDAHRGERR
jgi:hypothetical protein